MPKYLRQFLLFFSFFLLASTLLVSSFAAIGSPNIVVNKNAGWAGYKVSSPKPGSSIAVQSTWTVPTFMTGFCFGPGSHSTVQFDIRLSHIISTDAGSQLFVACLGTTPVYSIYYYLGGVAAKSLPAGDTVSPGDQMQTVAVITVATGAISVRIVDPTAGWIFTATGTEPASTKLSAAVEWFLFGTTTFLPKFNTFDTSGDVLRLGKNHGVLGSFLTISSDTVTIYNMVNSATSDILAQPGAISTTSSSFSFFWIQSS